MQPEPGLFLTLSTERETYAAVSTYSVGWLSNSFLHSSEQKKYFLPANCVLNSDAFSSTFIPQTGSVVMFPSSKRIFVRLRPIRLQRPFRCPPLSN